MSRDYSRKKTARRRPAATPKQKQTAKAGALTYLFVGLGIGLFIAFLVYLQNQSPTATQQQKLAHPAYAKKTPHSTTSGKTPAKQVIAKKTQGKNTPVKKAKQDQAKVERFQFYDMLPDVEIEASPGETEANRPEQAAKTGNTRTAPQASSNTAPRPVLYQLQIGAYSSMKKAEEIKARLAFMGVRSHISTRINANKQRIYRVRIGPSSDDKKLRQIQYKLKKYGFQPFLQKI